MEGMMTGLKLVEKGVVELDQKPIPAPGPLEALVKVTVCSACNTDLEIVDHLIMPPVIGRFVGHECVGVVQEVGSAVTYFKPGDRVCIPSITPSWRTRQVIQGVAQFDETTGGMAFDWGLTRDGTFSEYVVVRDVDMNCGKIPDGVTDIQASVVSDMVATAWNGVDQADIQLGNSVVVFGAGPVGLSAVGAAVLKGAARLFCITSNPMSAELAKKYGATDIIDRKKGDVVEQILDLNGGMVDVSVIAGGNAPVVEQAIRMTRGGGSICNVNAFYDDVVIPVAAWNSGMKTQKIMSHQCPGNRDMIERYLASIAYGRFDPAPMVTHINHGPETFEKTLRQKAEADVCKPVTVLD
jgi:threonine dehydrogenase-like Zn-dependent dehydrogenase